MAKTDRRRRYWSRNRGHIPYWAMDTDQYWGFDEDFLCRRERGVSFESSGRRQPGGRVVVSILVESGRRVEMAQAYRRSRIVRTATFNVQLDAFVPWNWPLWLLNRVNSIALLGIILWLLSADFLSGPMFVFGGSLHGGVIYGSCFFSVVRFIPIFRSTRDCITSKGVFGRIRFLTVATVGLFQFFHHWAGRNSQTWGGNVLF